MEKNFKRLDSLLENTGDMALKRRARRVVEELDLKDGDRVLDVGCGDGYYLHILSNLGLRLDLVGTDISRNDLKRARKNLKNKKVKLAYGDLMKKFPFDTNTFDKVVMSEVAEHLPDDVRGLREVYRVLKPGGVLCLTVPNSNYPFFWDPVNWVLDRLFRAHIRSGFFAGIWNQHERLYTPKQIKKVLHKAGFKVDICESLTFWCLPFNHYIVNIFARALAHGNLSTVTYSSLSKYSQNPSRPWYLNFAFWFVNKLDYMNDIWQPKGIGVSVFVRSVKK